MGSLRRLRLQTRINEASSLLAVCSPDLLSQLNTSQAWWIAHDEAGLDSLVSVVYSERGTGRLADESWQVTTLHLGDIDDNPILTDAEALAHSDGHVFVFGSSFIGPNGRQDKRRSFIARFAEHDVVCSQRLKDSDSAKGDSTKRRRKKDKRKSATRLAAPVSVLDLDSHLTRAINATINAQGVQLLKPHTRVARQMKKSIKAGAGLQPDMQPVNIEGACFVRDDLILGLRWPVTLDGQPLVVRLAGARSVLLSATWSAKDLTECLTVVFPVDAGGSPKRPVGVRGMSVDPGESGETIHLVTGPTDRDRAADKVRAAPYQHLRTHLANTKTGLLQTEQLQTFEGFRKVEAVAPLSPTHTDPNHDPGWIYALDDEDAIVLLIKS